MYNLFTNPPKPLVRPITIPRFYDVEKRIIADVEHVIDFYRSGTFFVPANHLLGRIITAMGVPLSYPLFQYYEVAKARCGQVGTLMRLTSPVNYGKWFNGVFYHGCNELILSVTSEDSADELIKDWRNLEPVRVLEHPLSNLKYMIPNGRPSNVESGLAVISIDIPKLMVMWRGYILTQQSLREENDSASTSLGSFIARYVLANMLKSQTDLVIINRMINLFRGAPMGDSILHYNFYISDYTEMLDDGLMDGLKRITELPMSYRDVLNQIPSIFNDYPLGMPDIAETRQVWWALFLTRFRLTNFLFDVAGERGRHFNRGLLNAFKINIRELRSDNILKKAVVPELYMDLEYEINRMMKEL